MSELANQGMQIISLLLQGWCLHTFFGSFLDSRWPRKRMCGLLAAVLYAALQLAVGWLLPSTGGNIPVFGRLAFTCCGLLLLTFCFYRARRLVAAFLLAAFLAVSQISFFLACTVLQLGNGLFDLWVWMVERGRIAIPQPYEAILEVTVLFLLFLLHTVTVAVLWISLRKIAGDFREKDYAIHRTELFFILAPALTGLLICVLLRKLMVTMEDGFPKILYDQHPVLTLLIPAILLLSLLSIWCGIKLFQDMIEHSRERGRNIILQRQIQGLQEHVAEMERVYSDVRSMKHDMKNTLSVIMQLAAESGSGENAELNAYLTELNRTMDNLEQRFKTGNTVADTLLNMKYHEGLRMIPQLKMDADQLLFPSDLGIQGYDLGVILGNALDNAIEACRKWKTQAPEAEAFVRLSSFRRGTMFFLEIENAFDGRLTRKRQEEFPATSKTDGAIHGIGLANIKSTAEKYHGGVEWSVKNNVFTLSVMMQEKGGEKNDI